jgi:hypothetical protein
MVVVGRVGDGLGMDGEMDMDRCTDHQYLPEALVITLVVLPVLVHVREGLIIAVGLHDIGDVGVFSARGAELGIALVAVVNPET